MEEFSRPHSLGEGGRVTYGTDDGLLVEFYIKPLLMEAMSQQAKKTGGVPYFEDRVMVRIHAPGNTRTTWDTFAKGIRYVYEGDEDDPGPLKGFEVDPDATDSDPIRFPKAWDRFMKQETKVSEGMPIEEWAAIPRSFALTLKAMNIHTVEALAQLTDANAQAFMGGLDWRNKAKAALSEVETLALASAEQDRANKAELELKQARKDIAAMKAQIAALESKKSKAA